MVYISSVALSQSYCSTVDKGEMPSDGHGNFVGRNAWAKFPMIQKRYKSVRRASVKGSKSKNLEPFN